MPGHPDRPLSRPGSLWAMCFLEGDGQSNESREGTHVLPRERLQAIDPVAQGQEAMGITGVTVPTMFRWCARISAGP